MRLRFVLCLFLGVLGGTLPAPAAADGAVPLARFAEGEVPGTAMAFELDARNGYSIFIGAFSGLYTGQDGGAGEVGVSVFREGGDGFAVYGAPATVSDAFVKADLGPFGRVDLARRPSGRQRTIPVRCSGGDTYTYEPATLEGIVAFRGEGGYTGGRATQVRLLPLLSSFCGRGSGRGESIGSGETGARIRGISYSHGRRLSFQVNKNHPRGRAMFSAEIRERRQGISIYRSAEGWIPAPSFRFDHHLRSATLNPPSPFSGSASLHRSPNSVGPRWRGDLAIDFPGRKVRLAGPGVHVSLVHACFTLSDRPSAESC
jgi:hypothetical protein